MKKTNKSSNAMKLAVLGAAGIAGLAATAYFFLGPKGKKNQKHAKAWAIKMKGDVIEKLETKAHDVSESIYNEIIDSVAGDYKKEMRASNNEINELSQDLKKHWKTISNLAKTSKHDAIKDTEKIAKKSKAVVKKSLHVKGR